MGYLVFILALIIICMTILVGLYMHHCSNNHVGIFTNPRYESRIRSLETEVEILKRGK